MSDNKHTYISNELTHFVGSNKKTLELQYKILKYIVFTKCLRHSIDTPDDYNQIHFDSKEIFSGNKLYNPHVVCFCDIPEENFRIHMKKYGTIGLSFKKDFIAKKGGAPVFYVPKTAKRIGDSRDFRGKYFDAAVQKFHELYEDLNNEYGTGITKNQIPAASEEPDDLDFNSLKEVYRFSVFYVFSYVKFFDHTLPDEDENNYYFEREWRIIGNLKFELEDVCHIYMPREYCNMAKKDYTFKNCQEKIKPTNVKE